MPDIFISYSSKDRDWVSNFASKLESKGFDVWWDITILPGQDFRSVIQEALDKSVCVVTVWSESSIKSPWVQAETYMAFEQKKLVPVLYQDVKIPVPFNSIQTADITEWNGDEDDYFFKKMLLGICSFFEDMVVDSDFLIDDDKNKGFEGLSSIESYFGFFITNFAPYDVWGLVRYTPLSTLILYFLYMEFHGALTFNNIIFSISLPSYVVWKPTIGDIAVLILISDVTYSAVKTRLNFTKVSNLHFQLILLLFIFFFLCFFSVISVNSITILIFSAIVFHVVWCQSLLIYLPNKEKNSASSTDILISSMRNLFPIKSEFFQMAPFWALLMVIFMIIGFLGENGEAGYLLLMMKLFFFSICFHFFFVLVKKERGQKIKPGIYLKLVVNVFLLLIAFWLFWALIKNTFFLLMLYSGESTDMFFYSFIAFNFFVILLSTAIRLYLAPMYVVIQEKSVFNAIFLSFKNSKERFDVIANPLLISLIIFMVLYYIDEVIKSSGAKYFYPFLYMIEFISIIFCIALQLAFFKEFKRTRGFNNMLY